LITTFKDDQRGEFLSNDFKIFYKENGIRRELTTIETPHQNGVAK
jgi:transposase InsO family protein